MTKKTCWSLIAGEIFLGLILGVVFKLPIETIATIVFILFLGPMIYFMKKL